MEKIFKNLKEPLFGRASEILQLSYLPLNVQSEILKNSSLYSGKNILHLYCIFLSEYLRTKDLYKSGLYILAAASILTEKTGGVTTSRMPTDKKVKVRIINFLK